MRQVTESNATIPRFASNDPPEVPVMTIKNIPVWRSEHIDNRKEKYLQRFHSGQHKAELEKIEGVRYLSPHSCRHTYVSQLQALGVDLETIKSIVGHADLDMTRHYLHVQEPIRQAAVQKFNDL